MNQPRVRRNEWQVLDPPALGSGWEPRLSVSVVVPAYDAGRLLPHVLAGLAAQTYPAHLLEVLVVDDGPEPPGATDALRLPEVRPENTRLLHVATENGGWGRANACHTGALAADGDVVHWYDADMLAEREQVEAQLRWHHLLDHVVVLGHKWFVDPAPALARTPAQTRAAVADGTVGGWFDDVERAPHGWVEEIYGRTDDLRQAGWYALRTHTGATASVRRDLYRAAGGLDPALRLGEDIALGARLGQAGAVFVPDRAAVSWHLGPTHVMQARERVNAYNQPFLAHGSPVLRGQRVPGRAYATPYLDVVLDTRGHPADAVTAVADAVLASTLTDLRLTLLGDWHTLTDGRTRVLADDYDARVVHAHYDREPRVRLLDRLPDGPPGPADASFVLTLPGTDWAPRRPALERLLLHLEHTHDGLRLLRLKDGATARLERTAALARARLTAEPGEPLDDVVAEVAGVEELPHGRTGFGPAARVRPGPVARTGGPPVDSAEAWARTDRAVD